MALIRGPKGKASCPICLVPSIVCSDLSISYELRNAASHKKAIDPKQYDTLAKREEKLMEMGLRPVEVKRYYCVNMLPDTKIECILENIKL